MRLLWSGFSSSSSITASQPSWWTWRRQYRNSSSNFKIHWLILLILGLHYTPDTQMYYLLPKRIVHQFSDYHSTGSMRKFLLTRKAPPFYYIQLHKKRMPEYLRRSIRTMPEFNFYKKKAHMIFTEKLRGNKTRPPTLHVNRLISRTKSKSKHPSNNFCQHSNIVFAE